MTKISIVQEDQTILSQWRHRRLNYLIQLRNKSPKYNEGKWQNRIDAIAQKIFFFFIFSTILATKTYVIQFIGNRVVKPSVKNFQIVFEEENREKKINDEKKNSSFDCDFR